MIKLKLFNQEKINHLLKQKDKNFILIDFKLIEDFSLLKNNNYIFVNLLESSNELLNRFLKKINSIYSDQNSYILFYKFFNQEKISKINNLEIDIDFLEIDIDWIYQKILNKELNEVINFIDQKEFEVKKKIYYLLAERLSKLKDKKTLKNLFDNNEKNENLILFILFSSKK